MALIPVQINRSDHTYALYHREQCSQKQLLNIGHMDDLAAQNGTLTDQKH
jgi:hypothetical protein